MINKNISIENYTGKSVYYFFIMMIFPIFTIILFHNLPKVSSLILLLFISIGIYIIYNYYIQDKKFEKTYVWEKAKGKVVKKRVVLLLHESLHSHIHRFKKQTDSFKIDITYKYTYCEKEYTSNRYALSYSDDAVDCNYLYTINDAKKTMYRITKDKQVTIYINPENPEESVIMRGKSSLYSFSYGLLIVYIIVLSILMYLVFTI